MAAEPKTKPNGGSVAAYLDRVRHEAKQRDAKALVELFHDVTGEKPVMWGESIVGFGSYQTKSGAWPLTGFAARKADLTLYVGAGRQAELLKSLGKHKVGSSCLYLKRLSDVDMGVLRQVIADSFRHMREANPA